MEKWGEPHTAYSESGPTKVSPAGASPHKAAAGWIEVKAGMDFPTGVWLFGGLREIPSSLPIQFSWEGNNRDGNI